MGQGRPLGESWAGLTCLNRGEIVFEPSRGVLIGKNFYCLDFGQGCLKLEYELTMPKQSQRA